MPALSLGKSDIDPPVQRWGGVCLCCFQWGPTSLPAATLTDFSQAERSNLLFMFPFNRGMKRLTPQVICELIKEEHVEAVF